MENLLVNKVAAVKEVRQAAEYQKKKQACILTGLAGSSKPCGHEDAGRSVIMLRAGVIII